MRDSQRQRVYDAEYAWKQRMNFPFLSKSQARARIRAIMRSKWWAEHTPEWRAKLEIKFIRGFTSRGHHAFIKLTNGGQNEKTILHELCHVAIQRIQSYRSRWDQAPHGWMYATMMISLVSRFHGVEAANLLKQEYRRYGVKFKSSEALDAVFTRKTPNKSRLRGFHDDRKEAFVQALQLRQQAGADHPAT
jgi:hypothetical protein